MRQHCISMFLFAILIASSISYAHAEKARLHISLQEIPIEPEIMVELWVSWGAQIKQVPPTWLRRYEFIEPGNRRTGTIKLKTPPENVDEVVKSFIIYGRILDRNDKRIVGFIPANLHKIEDFKSINQIKIRLKPYSNFTEAFKASYPLYFNRDRGFIKTENVRSVLRSFRLLIEYAGETGVNIDDSTWTRINSFFLSNGRYFKRGGSAELSEILAYLKTYVSASKNSDVYRFYASFLNKVVGLVVSVRSGRGMGPVKRISHVEARPHKVLSFCW